MRPFFSTRKDQKSIKYRKVAVIIKEKKENYKMGYK